MRVVHRLQVVPVVSQLTELGSPELARTGEGLTPASRVLEPLSVPALELVWLQAPGLV